MYRKTVKKILLFLFMITFILTGSACTARRSDTPSDMSSISTLDMYFIDVGQGDATLIRTPDGRNILIDAGPGASAKKLVQFLNSNKVETIDYLISTHPHEDHIGGMVNVLDNFDVKMVLDPAYAHTSYTFEKYLSKVDELDIPFTAARAGDRYIIGDVYLEILWPVSVPDKVDDLNEISVVSRVTYKDFSLILTGDIGTDTEKAMYDQGLLKSTTALKVAHHGSRGSTSSIFIRTVDPEIAVISVGEGNSYGHPTQKALDALKNVDHLYRTDLDGTIHVISDGNEFEITTEKGTSQSQTANSSTVYYGNSNSHVFHTNSCSSISQTKPSNLVKFQTRESAIKDGDRPCKNCNP